MCKGSEIDYAVIPHVPLGISDDIDSFFDKPLGVEIDRAIDILEMASVDITEIVSAQKVLPPEIVQEISNVVLSVSVHLTDKAKAWFEVAHTYWKKLFDLYTEHLSFYVNEHGFYKSVEHLIEDNRYLDSNFDVYKGDFHFNWIKLIDELMERVYLFIYADKKMVDYSIFSPKDKCQLPHS